MAIYRGPGGAGDANSDITINLVTELTQDAEAAQAAAASSASDAASSAAAALTSENNASPVNAIVSEITTVAGISSDVTTVAGIDTDVTTVSGNNANVTTVAGIASDVTTVATNNTNVTTVATDIANVNTTATNITNVNTVAGISSDVTAVVADATDIGTVATDLAGSDTIGTVATNIANVNTVAGISSDVTAVVADQADIGTVATNIANVNTVAGVSTDVTTVAGINADVTAVAADATDIGTVATNIANVNTVATNNTNVTTVATNIADVQAAATNIADIQAVADEVAKVITVANDLNEATSEIDTVAASIANVDTVGTNIASVNNVSANIDSVNNFGDTYFVSATAPSSPTEGDLWFDTTTQVMKVYTTSGFANAGSSVNGTSERQNYVVGTPSGAYTGSTTVFPATYDAGYVDVYLNGVKLVTGTDFTATNGTDITLTSAATSGDAVNIIGYGTFELANFSINDANDVNTAGVTDGQALIYNSTSGDFEAGDVSVDLSPYAPLASPALTGTPTAPTATTGTNTTQLATTAFVQTELGTVTTDLVGDTTPQLGGNLDTNGNDITFGDNDKAIFGTGSDLQIYHDGSNSFINDTGTGNLIVRGVNVTLQDSTTKQYLSTNESTGAATLFHNSNAKLATTSTGVSVTGDLSVSGSISGAGKILQVVQAIDTVNRSMTFSQDVWHTVPNLTATITPSSASSKILMMARIFFEWDAGDMWNLNYAPARGGSQFNISTTTMSSPATNAQNRAMGSVFSTENNNDTFTTPEGIVFSTIDFPNTTSATSYTVQMINTNNGGSMYFNSTVSLSNPNAVGMTSEIILMEIGA